MKSGKPRAKRPMTEAQLASLAKARERLRAARAAGGTVGDQFDPLDPRRGEDASLPQQIVYGSTAFDDKEPTPSGSPDSVDPFQLFLVTLPADARELLSEDELRVIYNEQLAKALAEKKAGLKKTAAESALHAARMEAGLVPAATAEAMQTARRNAEIVSAVIELPPAGEDGQVADIGIRIDQKVYLHGHRYEFTRGQWDSYREILYRAAQHELEFKGQNTRQRRYLLGRAMGSVNTHIALNPDGSLA